MNLTLIKGLFLALIAYVIAFTQTNGLPTDLIHWEVLVLALVGTSIGYFVQSYFLPTTSVLGSINWKDILKGAIILVANFFSTIGADKLTGTIVDFKMIGVGLGSLLLGYFVKQAGSLIPAKPLA
jgi:hypothetical protein